ncbi:MAG: hypothetical protein ACRD4O_01565 [Bryobacteraceae bacterium]
MPKKVLPWRSIPGSPIHNEGRVRFELNGENCTRLSIQLSYLPPAGVAGHVLIKLFSADPRQAMDDDLVRLNLFSKWGRLARMAKSLRETIYLQA